MFLLFTFECVILGEMLSSFSTSVPHSIPPLLHPSISIFSWSSFSISSSSPSSFLSPQLIVLSLFSTELLVFPSRHVKHQRVPGEPLRRGDHPSGQDPLLRRHQHGDSKSNGSEQRRRDQERGVELRAPTAICGEGSWRRRGRGGEESCLLLPLQEEEVMSWRQDYDRLCFIYFLAF